MPLESCMILLDNSEYMRNGDYVPTRLDAQQDAANLLVNHKTQSNPESTVGVIAMSGTTGSGPGAGGTGAELLVSPTDDMGKILAALHGVPTRGAGDSAISGVDIPASVQVASLALKHRRNKNGAQRVVVFVGSPLGSSVESRQLQRAGRQLKKNNVAIDIVALGELEQNEEKLRELVDAANGTNDEGGRTCNLVTIPAGVLPSDVLVGSPIVGGGMGGGGGGGGAAAAAAAGGGGGGDAFAEYGGVDPNMDPELAMALRVSMEEERARQERAAAAQAEAAAASEEGKEGESGDGDGASGEGMEVDAEGKPAADNAAAAPKAEEAPAAAAAAAGMGMGMGGEDDEDALLQQALAMSMAESYAAPDDAGAESGAAVKKEEAEDSKPTASEAAPMETDEDAEMQMALAMSMQAESEAAGGGGGEAKAEFQDPQFVNQLLGSLPGVDPNDPDIQNALKNLKKEDGDKKDDKKDGEGK